MAINILFNAVNINSMQSNAGIFFGSNTATGWNSPTKYNSSIYGAGLGNLYASNLAITNDMDAVDQANADPDVQPTSQIQTL